MKTKVRKRSVEDTLKGHLLSIILFVVVFGLFLSGISSAEKSSASEGKKVLEQNIHKAVVSCYALEGAYPENLEYLKENYGLIIDETKYDVLYIAFASNIMPDISVNEIEESEENPFMN